MLRVEDQEERRGHSRRSPAESRPARDLLEELTPAVGASSRSAPAWSLLLLREELGLHF